ncbi:KdsC family phosphatase [Vreelandella aquamarina]|uniref:3-deoxy-D-manno-octulosonate 8-phosphate phosphatase KdsC n=1 Tax=Vreelandella aquamarina TaxID=77097 RepID=A0A6F8SVR0_9GAMM|nr:MULTISPECIES: HAD hydrolase family protein [Halomonas]MEC9020213.1 HAD hydrolase family protein [Pseudomonadota bacterium]MCC4290152.1 HAD hydrolase family protein [Halomonas axialensis]MED5458627.1 HAD hydrolase family protein [Pseudomonadota bacterium]MEE3110749.1 HAD hydrolase family protein [Pseudomonadota bacterium]TKJ11926.1 HAD family hydrolase [Halomonas sp. 15WGF]
MALPDALLDRLRRVKLLAIDVDGVLTDGRLYFQADGIEIKAFHTQDGHGLKLLKRVGIHVALITGRDSPMVSQRAAALGITHVYQGCEDKLTTLRALCQRLDITLEQVAYCGDDLPDLAPIKRSGVGITVPNAPDYMHPHADWITERLGGHGAVREICDTLLTSQGHWDAVLDTYLHGQS